MQRFIQCTARHCRTGLVLYRVKETRPTRLPNLRYFSRLQPCLKDGFKLPSWVRWYEQETPNSPITRDVEDEPEEMDEEDEKEIARLKAQIAKLDKELEELEGANLDPLTPEEQSEIKAAVGDDVLMQGDMEQLEDTERSFDTPDLRIKHAPPNAQNTILGHLTKWLYKAAQQKESFICQKELWRWYVRCKHSIPSFFPLISDAAWKVLWQSQYDLDRNNKWRSTHLRVLVEDMLQSQRDLTIPQRTVYIECLMIEGRHQEAIERWQKEEVEVRANEKFSQDFEDLGVKLYSEAGQPQKAQELALSITETSETPRARILVPVIASWARSNDNESVKLAWTLYVRLRAQLSTHITIDDFDSLCMCFLNVGRTDLALAVFKDLMLADGKSEYDSQELFRKAPGYVDILQSYSGSAERLMEVSLTALTVLPRRFRQKWFFASWMKRLIGKGHVNAASAVVGVMYQRGIKPDPMHLNGVIGAWFRNGTAEDKKKALITSWAMIRHRLNIVEEQRDLATNSLCVTMLGELPVAAPLHEHGAIPPASIETFSVLLLHYTRTQMWSQAEQVQLALAAAEIQPNAFFMNHLLYAELRKHNAESAWKLYKKMSQTTRPDAETFVCLWDCQKANLSDFNHAVSKSFPDPRALFCEMIENITTMQGRNLSSAKEEIKGESYHQIIRCFCLANDLQGIVVALHALKSYLDVYPDEATVRTITIQVARQAEAKPGRARHQRYRRSRFSERPDADRNFLNVVNRTALLTQQRAGELHDRNFDLDNVDEKFEQNEQLWLLTRLLREEIAQKESLHESDIESLERVAWKMGVGGIMFVDPLLPVQVPGEVTLPGKSV